jgi:hypothetical protein
MVTVLHARQRIARTIRAPLASVALMGIARLAPTASPGTAATSCAALTGIASIAHQRNAQIRLVPRASAVLMGIARRVRVIPSARVALSAWMETVKPPVPREKTAVMVFVNRSLVTANPRATNVPTVTRAAASPLAVQTSTAAMETAKTIRVTVAIPHALDVLGALTVIV